MTTGFLPLVHAAFNFLEDEYGLATMTEDEDKTRRFYGGFVSYASDRTVVTIAVDRGVLTSPAIGRAKDFGVSGGLGHINLDRIYEFTVSTPQERSRLASRDLGELKSAWRSVVKERRLDLQHFGLVRIPAQTFESEIAAGLIAYARVLKEYADPYLRGDFSNWVELCEYEWHRLVAGEVVNNRRWGEELSVENVELRFPRLRAYLERLRSEAGQS